MQSNYYGKRLHAQKLFRVYETDILEVAQYLAAEINYVCRALTGTETVLELGAGYGRIVKEVAPHCSAIVGIDISGDNIALGKEYLKEVPNADMIVMDVHDLTFERSFDVVLCLQNGLSAMAATFGTLKCIMDLVAPGGRAYFSSYSAKFWEIRLQWFQEQASKGLLGEIDMEQTKEGIIVCKDGFQATTYSPERFEEIARSLGYPYEITEVGDASLFLTVHKG